VAIDKITMTRLGKQEMIVGATRVSCLTSGVVSITSIQGQIPNSMASKDRCILPQ
jgi:hypothetical protein